VLPALRPAALADGGALPRQAGQGGGRVAAPSGWCTVHRHAQLLSLASVPR
jgi:hypothetical protein